MFQFSLTDIPQYCQYKAGYYDGAAVTQMIMNGYPSPAARKLADQSDIYNWMESNQVEPAPYNAPGTMRDTIHHFNPPPPPAHFVAQAYSDAQAAMYDILLWMRRTNYPAATITGCGWVVITAFETDLDPEGNPNLQLLKVETNEPYPFCG